MMVQQGCETLVAVVPLPEALQQPASLLVVEGAACRGLKEEPRH